MYFTKGNCVANTSLDLYNIEKKEKYDVHSMYILTMNYGPPHIFTKYISWMHNFISHISVHPSQMANKRNHGGNEHIVVVNS